MSKRHTERVERVLQVRGAFALFTRPDSGRNKQTYVFPTPGGLRGLPQTIYHTERLEFVPLKVEILAPIRVVNVARRNLQGITYGSNQAVKGTRDSTIYLHDVRYRITYEVKGPQDDIRRWTQRADVGAFGMSPFLGTRECLAVLEPVDDTPPVDITLFEPAMCLSNNGPLRPVYCKQGVVTYPPETREALQNRRRGVSLEFTSIDEREGD